MDTAPSVLDAISPVVAASTAPLASVYVTLTKLEYVELVQAANSWKSLHARAVSRLEHVEDSYKRFVRQLQEHAKQREARLVADLEVTRARVRDLQQRVFARKSERRKAGTERQSHPMQPRAPRGQRRGAPGHGRRMLAHLCERREIAALDSPQCPACGEPLGDFPGTEDSEVLEIEVKAYRRVIQRRRYRPNCQCDCVPGIVTAPPPPRLIERGKFAQSVWVNVLLDKYLYGRPSHRLLQDLAHHGLDMSPGTLTGGLQTLAPLFDPLEAAMLEKLRSEQHWHADETRWAVFVPMEGKIGHRWYLWVYHSRSVVHYVLDKSRSAQVVEDELGEVACGIISCDRYSAYKKFARLHPTFVLAFCWAHQRRDFLELGNEYPLVLPWAMVWVDAIAHLYGLNDLRLQAPRGSTEYAACDGVLRQAVQVMAEQRNTALHQATLPEPAAKVLRSMDNHWEGLTVFVDHPGVPMDNNVAERAQRTPVVGRKNFYGSGSIWAAQLAATMYSLLMTAKLWKLNPRTWLSAYLQACGDAGNRAPLDIRAFLAWTMSASELVAMRACPLGQRALVQGWDTS